MSKNRLPVLIIFLWISTLATACSAGVSQPAAPTPAPSATPASATTPLADLAVAYPPPAAAETEPAAAAQLDAQPYPVEGAPSDDPVIEPIAVTYYTPSQQEGPYYPVDKPADRDNDLVDFAGAAGLPTGDVLEFGGKVYDSNGLPVEGIVIEIWQTDSSGVYLHPNDPSTGQRDPNFQFYGEALTAADGSYSFRTILPGLYEPRPRHIHVKVRLDGEELLTTQFYFAGEIDLQGDDAAMLIAAEPGLDAAGSPILLGKRDIILNVDLVDR